MFELLDISVKFYLFFFFENILGYWLLAAVIGYEAAVLSISCLQTVYVLRKCDFEITFAVAWVPWIFVPWRQAPAIPNSEHFLFVFCFVFNYY